MIIGLEGFFLSFDSYNQLISTNLFFVDEMTTMASDNCSYNQYACANYYFADDCIPKVWNYDGQCDCYDCSDEYYKKRGASAQPPQKYKIKFQGYIYVYIYLFVNQ